MIKIERKNKGNLYAHSKNKRLTKNFVDQRKEKRVIYALRKEAVKERGR